jgi:hypothetical protein
VRGDIEGLRTVNRLLERYEKVWRRRIDHGWSRGNGGFLGRGDDGVRVGLEQEARGDGGVG